MSDVELQAAIDTYLRARAALLELGKKYPHRFSGNDNIIGRVGEFLALQFLEWNQQQPRKALSSSNRGFDFSDGDLQTQVKVITAENTRGRTVRLVEPWNQFLLLQLDAEYRPFRLGLLTKAQFQRALEEEHMTSARPYVTRSMLGAKGLIGKYGKVYEQSALLEILAAALDPSIGKTSAKIVVDAEPSRIVCRASPSSQ